MGVEGHRDGRQTALTTLREEPVEDRAVAAVDAVEVAEGRHARTQGVRGGLEWSIAAQQHTLRSRGQHAAPARPQLPAGARTTCARTLAPDSPSTATRVPSGPMAATGSVRPGCSESIRWPYPSARPGPRRAAARRARRPPRRRAGRGHARLEVLGTRGELGEVLRVAEVVAPTRVRVRAVRWPRPRAPRRGLGPARGCTCPRRRPRARRGRRRRCRRRRSQPGGRGRRARRPSPGGRAGRPARRSAHGRRTARRRP